MFVGALARLPPSPGFASRRVVDKLPAPSCLRLVPAFELLNRQLLHGGFGLRFWSFASKILARHERPALLYQAHCPLVGQGVLVPQILARALHVGYPLTKCRSASVDQVGLRGARRPTEGV